MPHLKLDQALVDEARALAKHIVEPVIAYIGAHTTVAIERATLRLIGVDGIDEEGVPLPNRVVDRSLVPWISRTATQKTPASTIRLNAVHIHMKRLTFLVFFVSQGKLASFSEVFIIDSRCAQSQQLRVVITGFRCLEGWSGESQGYLLFIKAKVPIREHSDIDIQFR